MLLYVVLAERLHAASGRLLHDAGTHVHSCSQFWSLDQDADMAMQLLNEQAPEGCQSMPSCQSLFV